MSYSPYYYNPYRSYYTPYYSTYYSPYRLRDYDYPYTYRDWDYPYRSAYYDYPYRSAYLYDRPYTSYYSPYHSCCPHDDVVVEEEYLTPARRRTVTKNLHTGATRVTYTSP